jgi:hypothetical protein
MIKIEELKNGAKATYTRDGVKKPIFLHQLITRQDLETLEVTQGTVVYSVDELEIKEQSAPAVVVAAEVPVKKLTAKEIAAQAKIAAKKLAQETEE